MYKVPLYMYTSAYECIYEDRICRKRLEQTRSVHCLLTLYLRNLYIYLAKNV